MEKIDRSNSAIDIMTDFWQRTFDPDQYKTLDEYLEDTKTSLWKFHKIGINIPEGITLEEKCRIFMVELEKQNLLNLIT